MKLLKIMIPGLILMAAASVMPQSLNVTIDGTPVRFVGTQPMAVQGRVMVPLRGVLEQMGAFVGWDAITRTVFAQKSDVDVQLPIGSRTATVNGRSVALDVPAQIIGGSTMVPLRFLGETLGAEVAWNYTTRTVTIATGSNSGTNNDNGSSTPGSADGISSFSHNGSDWLKAGSTLKVVMKGTSGGTATFEIPGIVDKVAMKEVSSGRYESSWIVPSGKSLVVTGGKVIGQLRTGSAQKLIQAGDSVSIDTLAPKILNSTPDPDSIVAATRPTISVVTEDSGSGVDTEKVLMSVNGADVTDAASITRNFASYRPQTALKAGVNKAKVTVYDLAGNYTSQTWSFNVQGAGSVITSFTHSDVTDMQPGDVITAKMKGEANSTVNFVITSQAGNVIATKAMPETSAGVYEGEYTIRKNQDINGATISGTLKVASGQVYTVQAEGTVNAPALTDSSIPVITSPKEGNSVTTPLVITGKASPNTSVRITVEYSTKVLGLFETNGALTDQIATTNSKGIFKSSDISLTTLIQGSNTIYTINVTSVNANGDESEPTTVSVKGK
ncbi:MAG: copper amine oxidase N-terminal domain-containing protein [Armatimonadota bacterium]